MVCTERCLVTFMGASSTHCADNLSFPLKTNHVHHQPNAMWLYRLVTFTCSGLSAYHYIWHLLKNGNNYVSVFFPFSGAVGVIRASKSLATWSSTCAPTLGRNHTDVTSVDEPSYQPECWSPTSIHIQVSSLYARCWEISACLPKLIGFD